jgi:hypothetical protein
MIEFSYQLLYLIFPFLFVVFPLYITSTCVFNICLVKNIGLTYVFTLVKTLVFLC